MELSYPKECYKCGFFDTDFGCTCPSGEEWYACPIESKKPENKKDLEEYCKWYLSQLNGGN